MTNFLQVTDGAYTRATANQLNNVTTPLTIAGIDTTKFDAVTTGYALTIYDDRTYQFPVDDPNMEKVLVTAVTIAVNGSLTFTRPNPKPHIGSPILFLGVLSQHINNITTAINANEANIATNASNISSNTTAIAAKYTKPATGIPKTDLATDVQTSLGKADTALQTAPVTSVNMKTGAVMVTKSDVGLGNVDNTSDISKPISNATQVALNTKNSSDSSKSIVKSSIYSYTFEDFRTYNNRWTYSGSGYVTYTDGVMNLTTSNGAESKILRTLWSDILSGFDTVTFDVNLNGNTFAKYSDSPIFVFDNGTNYCYINLLNYATNGSTGWNTFIVPLNKFTTNGDSTPSAAGTGTILNTFSSLVASVIRTYDTGAKILSIRNIVLSDSTKTLIQDFTQPDILNTPKLGNSYWRFQGVDMMKNTKDNMTSQLSDTVIGSIVSASKAFNPTHYALSMPYDAASNYPSGGQPNSDGSTYALRWASVIRKAGYKVFWRQMPIEWEGIYSKTKNTTRGVGTASGIKAGTETGTYLKQIYDYIIANANQYAPGDIICPIPEPENGGINGINGSAPYQFSSASQFRAWLRDGITVVNLALEKINLKGQIAVGFYGTSGFITFGNTDNPKGFLDDRTIDAMTVVGMDDYPTPITNTSVDLGKFETLYGTNRPLAITEWGTINQTTDADRQAAIDTFTAVLKTKSYIYGMSYWTIAGTYTSGNANEDLLDSTTFAPIQGYQNLVNAFTSGTQQPGQYLSSLIAANAPVPVPTATFITSGTVKQQVYNVRDYGAVGNGTTVDSSAFQNAINAASAAGGGTVFASPGTYLISNVYLASNVYLRGAGIGSTILKLNPATGTLVIRVANGSTVDAVNVTTSDFTIDGNKDALTSSNTTKSYGYYIGTSTANVADIYVHHVEFKNCKTYACDVVNATRVQITDCFSHDNGYTTGTNNNCSGFEVLGDDVTITNCRAYNNANKGFIAGEGGVTHYRTKFINCIAKNNSFEGFYLHDGVTESGIFGGTSQGNTTGVTVAHTATVRNFIIGLTATGNSSNGIRLDTSSYTIVSNNILTANATGSVGNPELYLTNSNYNTVANNIVSSSNSNTSIVEQGTSDYNQFRANRYNKTFTVLGASSNITDTPDATTTVKGSLQLAGDLTGTAASPALIATGTAGTYGSASAIPVITTDSKGRVSGVTTVAPATQTPADATSSSKGIVQLAGDLSGTASAPTVPALANKANIASPTFTGTPAAPTAVSGTNTTQIATTQYVVSEIAARLAAADALVYKGAIDASTNPNYPAANAGDSYKISVAGRIGGASGQLVMPGDMIICLVDNTAAGTDASVGSNWDIIQYNVDSATTTTLGLIQLAGDLGGTAIAPTVPALTTKKNIITNQGTKTANFTAVPGGIHLVDASAGNVTVTFPTSIVGQEFQIKKIDAKVPVGSTTGIVILSGKINNVANATVQLRKINQGKQAVADGTGGWLIALGDLDITSLYAATDEPGTVQLAGDLGGTAQSPTTPTAVHLTGAETIAGIKTFNSSPTVPTPTNATDATNKTYVDNAITAAATGISRNVSTVTASITAGSTARTDYVYNVTNTATITLPTAVGNTNLYTVTLINTGTTVTVATTNSETINGSVTAVYANQYTSYDFLSNGANWYIR